MLDAVVCVIYNQWIRCHGVKSLKVVVQRALIELPGSRCSVGGEEEGRGKSQSTKREAACYQEDADSQLITCGSCDITVHQSEPRP